MLFNSLNFIFFFGLVVVLYYNLPSRYRWLLLLIASCYFYIVFVPVYILVLFFLIITDYILGIKIKNADDSNRKKFLIISIVANLATLFVFKYFNFFNENLFQFAKLIHWNYSLITLKLLLPLGLSFHIFQSLSYVIEVYRGKQKAEKNLGIYALYVMFFPQLVAGPIERPKHMLPQFHSDHNFKNNNVTRGLELMLWGFFKKLVIADRLALVINHIYGNPFQANGLLLILAIILFAYQIYCDFSGYSDIAVGAALVLGYDLTNNFNRPFASSSIAEFWRRWHISLSSWLRDYLYYPLIFSRKKLTPFWLYSSLMITFILIGFWHGANWTYIVFGGLHGVYLTVASLTSGLRQFISNKLRLIKLPRLYRSWQTIITFMLVAISLVFFRSKSLYEASYILTHVGQGLNKILDLNYLRFNMFVEPVLGVGKIGLLIPLIAIVFLEIIQFYQSRAGSLHLFESKSRWIRWGWYYTLSLIILFFAYSASTRFIYFQF